MNQRPRASLGRILDDLGATLLQPVCGSCDRDESVGGVAIHDPMDEPVLPEHALVLGVGLDEPADIAAVVDTLGRKQARALVLRAPAPIDEHVVEAVNGAGVVLLELTRGAAWTQLAALLRSLLSEGDVGVDEPETLAGIPSGDLFALANAVSALLDAPITIEDRSSRVLAFSGHQEEADAGRVETVLGRQVPSRYVQVLTERGAFRDLYRSEEPIYIDPVSFDPNDQGLPRVAMAVRAGDEFLGSIWAAVQEPLSEERTRGLCEAAKVVALHLLRIRAGADVERRLRADLVGTALEGGSGAHEAVTRLGLTDQPVVVCALAIVPPTDQLPTIDADAALAQQRQRLADALAMHLSAIHPRCATALIGDVVYAIIPVGSDSGTNTVVRVTREFLERTGERVDAVVGIGSVAADVEGFAQSRQCADRVLRVLRASGRSHRIAQLSDVHVEVLLLELRDLVVAQGDQITGPIATLQVYDEEHHTDLVATLRAWLDAFGDVVAAAESLFIHPNTFRYRLRRIAEVGNIDLSDPDARFAAMLQLRVIA